MSHVVVDLHCIHVRTYERHYCFPHTQAATRLHSAACNGDIATVRRLMTLGHVDVNATDEVGVSSPSFLNVIGGHTILWLGTVSSLCHGPM